MNGASGKYGFYAAVAAWHGSYYTAHKVKTVQTKGRMFVSDAARIRALEIRFMENRSFVVKMADYLVGVFGTARFFFISLVVTVLWVVLNLEILPNIKPFDQYPFILLTMVASVGAIFMTIVILISQNRQASINTLRNELLLQMTVISEREITKILRLLADRKSFQDRELRQMIRETNVTAIERILQEQLKNGNAH